jgi:hypothetical protein
MHKSKQLWMVAAPLVAALLAGSWACKKQKEEADQDRSAPLVSVLSMGDPRTSGQLLDGFWAVENHAWRWTKHSFSVVLQQPPAATLKGANLEFRCTLPDAVITRRKEVVLSVRVGGEALPPETYTAAGQYLYKADVPASAFQGKDPVSVFFTTDKFLAAGEVEGRELALIARSVILMPK